MGPYNQQSPKAASRLVLAQTLSLSLLFSRQKERQRLPGKHSTASPCPRKHIRLHSQSTIHHAAPSLLLPHLSPPSFFLSPPGAHTSLPIQASSQGPLPKGNLGSKTNITPALHLQSCCAFPLRFPSILPTSRCTSLLFWQVHGQERPRGKGPAKIFFLIDMERLFPTIFPGRHNVSPKVGEESVAQQLQP